jgi:hypothetical protein
MANTRSANTALQFILLVSLAATPAQAALYSLAASGTISQNSSGDATIPVGTPWSFKLTYNTAAPDLDFEVSARPIQRSEDSRILLRPLPTSFRIGDRPES